MSKTFFTSDLHLGHANIIKYCSRTIFMTKEDRKIFENLAFDKAIKWRPSQESLNNMNEGLINRWNERVNQEDIVFHIGDFCFKSANEFRGEGQNIKALKWEERLNGRIIFIRGNHDKNNQVKTRINNIVLNLNDGHLINLVHDPCKADLRYEINLTGHVHNNWECKRIKSNCGFTDCINVGVDVWNFYPVTYEGIKERYDTWVKKL